MESLLSNGAAYIFSAVEYVLAYVVAAVSHGLHGHLEYLRQQAVPDSNSDDAFVIRWARFYGLNRIEAGRQTMTVTVEVDPSEDPTMPVGTRWVNSAGEVFLTQTDVSGLEPVDAVVPLSIVMIAEEPGPREAPFTILSLQTPITGVYPDAVLDRGEDITLGTEQETIPELLARLRQRIEAPSGGGTKADYVRWAFEAGTAATRFFVRSGSELSEDANSVITFAVVDAYTDAGVYDSTGRISVSDEAAVQAYHEARAPVTAVPIVRGQNGDLTLTAQDFTIEIVPNTEAIQTKIQAALADLYLRDAEPGVAVTMNAVLATLAGVLGLESFEVTDPTFFALVDPNELVYLGTITFEDP